MNRFSTRDHTRGTLELSGWLVFNDQGDLKLVRGRPSLAPAERAAAISLTVPLALFKTPELAVTIVVTDAGGPAVDLNVAASTISEAIARGTDLKVEVRAAADVAE